MRAVEGGRTFAHRLVGKLEDHRAFVLREAAHHLAAALDRRHAHHLAELDIVMLRRKIVGELVVTGARVHSARHPSEIVMEAAAWRVNVEQPCAVRSWVRERVQQADRCGDVRACSEAKPFVLDEKLGLSFEHIERIDVVVVGVRVGPFEAGLELELDQRQLLAAYLDRRDSIFALKPLAFSGREKKGFRSVAAAAWRSVDAVETAGLTAIPCLKIPCETTVRRVEVQEPRARSAPEPMHDLPRSADACARGQHLLLVVNQDRKLALEDVERIRVLPMEVRIRSGPRVREKRLCDAELVEIRLDHDPSAEERFAFAGPVHDSGHRRRL